MGACATRSHSRRQSPPSSRSRRPPTRLPYVRYGLQDDAWLAYGPGTLDERIDTLDGMGVTLVRYTLDWSKIEPRKGKYEWDQADAILRGSERAGARTGRDSLGNAALGERRPLAELGADVRNGRSPASPRKAADRYPFVRNWLIWNEPNQRRWLRPTSPRVYTQTLLNPAYAAIHRATPGAKVAGGVTAPRGSYLGISPVDFIRGMGAAHARLDAYAHNPYPLRRFETPSTGGCDHCETITMATIDRLLREVGKAFGRDADLADRVRLPDEPARPAARRLPGAAGPLPRRGGAARARDAVRRHADPVPLPGRARRGSLAERAADGERAREGLAALGDPAARPGHPQRAADGALGAGATGRGHAALRAAAVPERWLALGRRPADDHVAGLSLAHGARRGRAPCSASGIRRRGSPARVLRVS